MSRVMWFFDPPDESSLPERLQGLFQKARESVGFVPNVFRAYSYRPERLPRGSGTSSSCTCPPSTSTRPTGR